MRITTTIKTISLGETPSWFGNVDLHIECESGISFRVRDTAPNRRAYTIGRDVQLTVEPK